MSSDPANLAAKGAAALSSQDYPTAIDFYTKALVSSPTSVDYHIKRSTAYQRSGNYTSALADAELAAVLAQRRGNRELLSSAQLRRGISLLLLERYGDAGVCFRWAEKYNVNDKSIGFWQKKLEMELNKVEEDDLRREVMVKEFPDVEIPKPAPTKKAAPPEPPVGGGRIEELPDDYEEPSKQDKGKGKAVEEPKKAEPAPAPKGVTTPADKIRHEWYQTNNNVTISIFVKGVPKDETTVELEDRSLAVTFPLASGSDFNFTLDPLCHPIKPSESTYKILGTKIEFTLIKSEPGRKWATLESTEPVTSPQTATTTAAPPKPPTADKPPAYPTSSRHGPKNWDKVVGDLASASKAKKAAGKESKDAAATTSPKDDEIDYADLDDDDFSSDPVNGFFKKLYKDADPDTRRAMIKSYQESNGTALSTNWSEVKRGKVETSPPDGMEAKQWGA
ncbi:hypothetical protein ABW19_dt0205285 [Dactylella cylindrospora]|nr:hypothetical protein ABW19_dt0205285 [Dactylella cylindrospora]